MTPGFQIRCRTPDLDSTSLSVENTRDLYAPSVSRKRKPVFLQTLSSEATDVNKRTVPGAPACSG
jgi:hypothetical protein